MMLGTGWIQILLEVTFLWLLFACGYQDVKKRRVKNAYVLYLVFILPVVLLVEDLSSRSKVDLIVWFVTSVLVYSCYIYDYISAGDVKVIVVSSAIGYTLHGAVFILVYPLALLLDEVWYRYIARKSESTPLVWAWAWASGVFSAAKLLLRMKV